MQSASDTLYWATQKKPMGPFLAEHRQHLVLHQLMTYTQQNERARIISLRIRKVSSRGEEYASINSFPKPDEAVNGWSRNCAKLRDFVCIVFGLSGFPSR